MFDRNACVRQKCSYSANIFVFEKDVRVRYIRSQATRIYIYIYIYVDIYIYIYTYTYTCGGGGGVVVVGGANLTYFGYMGSY